MMGTRNERLAQLPWWRAEAVAGATALVAGGGALGNEVIKNLLLLGCGHIVVVDFDTVALSNLSRSVLFQAGDVGRKKVEAIVERAQAINPDCRVVGLDGDLRSKISAGMVRRVDVIFGCLDNLAGRLALNQLAGAAGRPWIDGGISTFEGTVSLFAGEDGACYACGLTAEDFQELNLRRSCPAYAARAAGGAGVPTTPAISAIIAAWMVQIGLKWVHGQNRPPQVPVSMQLRCDTAYDRFWKIKLPKHPECLAHPVAVRNVLSDCAPACTDSWATILQACEEALDAGGVTLELPLPLARLAECPACGKVEAPWLAVTAEQTLACGACGEATALTLTQQINHDSACLDRAASACGYPPWTWLVAETLDGTRATVELSGPAWFPLAAWKTPLC